MSPSVNAKEMAMTVQESTLLLSADQAATLAGVLPSSVLALARQGKLSSRLTSTGRVLIERASLERWLDQRFLNAGGTHDPARISLVEAGQLSHQKPASLREYVKRGGLQAHWNETGKLILDRQEFLEWNARLPPLRNQLDPSVRWFSMEEVDKLVGSKAGFASRLAREGELKATPCRTPHHSYVVAEADLKEWLKERAKKFPQADLRGEAMTLEAAAERFGVKYALLWHAVKRKLIPASRQQHIGPALILVGSQDVEQFLETRLLDKSWTLRRAAEFVGMDYPLLVRAARAGQLPTRVEIHPHWGRRQVVEPEALMKWLATQPVPYRKEAAHLSGAATIEEAARLSLQRVDSVREEIAQGKLPALCELIPRRALDRWLKQRGFPPSWKDHLHAEWMRTEDAARLVAVSESAILVWLKSGHLQGEQRGRRWLVRRASLLEQRKVAEDPGWISRAQAISGYSVSKATLRRALKSGLLPARKLVVRGHKRIRIRVEDLERFLKEHPEPLQPEPVDFDPEAHCFNVAQAAARARISVNVVHADMAKGLLHGSKHAGSYFFTRPEVEDWLKKRFWRKGGTRRPGMISLKEGAHRSGYSVVYLSEQVKQAHLSRYRNPAGKLILNEAEFNEWLSAHGGRGGELREGEWTLSRIGRRLGIRGSSVHRHIVKGNLLARRAGGKLWAVAEADLEKWISQYFPGR